MSQILAYLRTSTDKQDLDQQRLQILAYADQHQLHIDDFIALQISSRRTATERRLDEIFQRLNAGDTLIVTELSRLEAGLAPISRTQNLSHRTHLKIMRAEVAQGGMTARAIVEAHHIFKDNSTGFGAGVKDTVSTFALERCPEAF